MRNRIASLGLIKTVALITVIVCTLTIVIYGVIALVLNYFVGYQPTLVGLIFPVITPLVITPIVSVFFVNLILKLHRLEGEVRELATDDALTGLLNRRTFLTATELMMNEALRHKTQFAVALLDLDFFKAINDTYGHVAGDEVLRTIGAICKKLPRKSDVVGRYGGEEFIFFLPNCDENNARTLCDRLHQAIRTTSVVFQDNTISITGSIGVFVHSGGEISHTGNLQGLDHFINLADIALYEAKDRGRNQTCIYRDDDGSTQPDLF